VRVPPSRWSLRPSTLFIAALVAIAYAPLLLTHRGMVGADTKAYLYLDPARFLGRASSMWDPSSGMGTVTHENIGYLWPMGPWYRLFAAVGVPTWVAQRLWTGTLLLLAGLGVRWLVRTLGGNGPGLAVATLSYMLSPYVLQYEARISAILMGFSALPWMIGLTIRGVRTGGWRHPSLFALVAATAGSVNASCMVFAALGAVLWLPYAVWGLGEATARRAVGTFAKMLGLSVLTSLWWLVALAIESGYGLNILRYTETVETVSQTGLPFEALRGLGNWYFYGRDAIGPWVQPATEFTQWGWLLAISYLLPVLSFASAAMIRWRYKLYFAGLILVGVAFAVGVYPYDHPSPIGTILKSFDNGSTLGLALRSTGRAVPLVALGTGMLLGAGVDALWRRRAAADLADRRRRRRTALAAAAAGTVTVLVALDMAPLWLGQFVDNNLQAPDHVPSYWSQAAAYVGTQGKAGSSAAAGYATRVLELPGADFSHYRWGATLDPVTPGLTNRPVVGRELQPAGGAASADLVRALDTTLQEGVFELSALAPLARKMGVGDVLLRSDLQYERFRTPRPRATWSLFDPPPAGLDSPVTFGPQVAETPVIPYTDNTTLGTPATAPDPPAVAVFGVQQPEPIIRTEPATDPMILAGDGEGMIDVAAAGLLNPTQPVFYAADLGVHPGTLSQALSEGADLVVTDTNRLRAQRWGTIRDIYGYTEQPGETPLVADPNDARLPLFPGAGTDAYTVAELGGAVDVRASDYGNVVSYTPSHRPDLAIDGNAGTAWEVGALGNPVGERLRIDLTRSVTTGQVTLAQPFIAPKPPLPGEAASTAPIVPPGYRYITRVTLTFDGGHPIVRSLDLSSLSSHGEQLTFPVRTFKRLEIRIDDVNLQLTNLSSANGVGFAEVRIGQPASAPQVDEVLRLPTDLLDQAGAGSIGHRLYLVMTRDRANPSDTFTSDAEPALARTFDLPTGRTFALSGTARVSALAPDQEVDRWLGRPDPPITNSSGRLPGDLAGRSSSALDGDPSTFWSPGLGPQVGNWISVNLPHPVTLHDWTMQVVADGQHSVPTRLRIKVDNQPDIIVNLPPVHDVGRQDATVGVPVSIPTVTAHSRVTVVIDAVRPVETLDSLSQQQTLLPVGIAELGIPGVTVPPAATSVPSGCRTDLLTVDGKPVGLRILGSTQSAANRDGLSMQACGPGVDGSGALALGPGPHVMRTTPGRVTGIDIDRLVLASDKGGGPLAGEAAGAVQAGFSAPPSAAPGATSGPAASPASSPAVRVISQTATSAHIQVAPAASAAPFWLVLGESLSSGWTARITGKGGQSLGAPRLIDGYANGWLVTPSVGQPLSIVLTWTPQKRVTEALWLSAAAGVLCVGLAVFPVRRRARRAWAALGVSGLSEEPAAFRSWRAFDPTLTQREAITVVAVCAIVAGLLIGWLAGLIVAGIVALGLRRGRWQVLPGAAAVAAVLLSGLFVTQQQLAHRYPLVLQWPQHFKAVAGLAWVGIVLFAADALVRHLRGRRRGRQ
jgi:hypothetical protein